MADEIGNVKNLVRKQTEEIIERNNDSPRNGSPSKYDHDNVWFDIEKSQERYEALLNSYQNIIKDKDEHIHQLEEEITNCRKERLKLEDEHFQMVRDKDRQISEAERNGQDKSIKLDQATKDYNVNLANMTAKVGNLEDGAKKNIKELTSLTSQLQDANEQIQELRKQLNEELESHIDLTGQMTSAQKENIKMSKQINTGKIDADKKLIDQITKAEEEVKDLQQNNEVLKASNLIEREKVKSKEKEKLDI